MVWKQVIRCSTFLKGVWEGLINVISWKTGPCAPSRNNSLSSKSLLSTIAIGMKKHFVRLDLSQVLRLLLELGKLTWWEETAALPALRTWSCSAEEAVRATNSLTEDYVVLWCNTVQSGRNFYQCFGETYCLHRNVEVLFVTEGHVLLECDAVHFHIQR